MIEVKFRYGYTDGNKWIFETFTLDQIEGGDQFDYISDSPLLKDYRIKTRDLFTGIMDTKGKEIYENDKVKNDNGKFREVGWNDRRSQLGLYGRVFECWITNELISDGWEIVGNIHE